MRSVIPDRQSVRQSSSHTMQSPLSREPLDNDALWRMHQREVPKQVDPGGKTRDRWGSGNDARLSPMDVDRSTNNLTHLRPSTASDNHTVPSSRFTRPSTSISPPPQSSSPRAHEAQVFTRTTYLPQKGTNSNSTIEVLTRQMGMSATAANESSTSNGQSTMPAREPKVVPTSELIGVVTRAIDSEFSSTS